MSMADTFGIIEEFLFYPNKERENIQVLSNLTAMMFMFKELYLRKMQFYVRM